MIIDHYNINILIHVFPSISLYIDYINIILHHITTVLLKVTDIVSCLAFEPFPPLPFFDPFHSFEVNALAGRFKS